MNNILQFTPRKNLNRQSNLKEFIEFAKNNLSIWSNEPGFEWEDPSWNVLNTSARFITLENSSLHHTKRISKKYMMPNSFIDLAKAYIRHRHTFDPHKNVGREMRALRLIEKVLREDSASSPDITKFDQRHFDKIISLAVDDKARQPVISEVLRILNTLATLGIVSPSVEYFKNPYLRNKSYRYLRGEYADKKHKEKKLPNQDALLAIAEIFSLGYKQPLLDIDVVVTSITCILLSTPIRISELLRFRTDCIRTDHDSHGNIQKYLHFWIPKIQQFIPKPIPETMSTATQEAIDRLINITEEGRKLALYMESNPTKFYRHANCPAVEDDEILSVDQVVQALGFRGKGSAYTFMKRLTGTHSLANHTLNSLWKIVLKEHYNKNPYFPYQTKPTEGSLTPLKMSESLMCFRSGQFTINLNTSPVLLQPFNSDAFCKRVSPSDTEKGKLLCFFRRHGYKAFSFKSHSSRHLLTQLGRQVHIPIEFLTSWGGRATKEQTLTYINDDPENIADKAAKLQGTKQIQSHKIPLTDEEASILKHGPFQRSRYGICLKSWRAGPCNRHADCLNCSDLIMCKGDKLAAETVALELKQQKLTLNSATLELEQGELSASRWVTVYTKQVQRLEALLDILTNPKVPNGSPITINNPKNFNHECVTINNVLSKPKPGLNDNSRIINHSQETKLHDRSYLKTKYGDELLACLDLLSQPNDDQI